MSKLFRNKARHASTGKVKRGFTLIELLIVITIIAILAAILFPVFARVRENARRTACASNMKQLALAFTMYANDNGERLPGATDNGSEGTAQTYGEGQAGGWMFYDQFGKGADNAKFDVTQGSIYPYVRNAQIYLCPSDTIGQVTGNSYAANACVSLQVRAPEAGGKPGVRPAYSQPDDVFKKGAGFSRGLKLSRVLKPSEYMMLAEETRADNKDGIPPATDRSTDDAYYNAYVDGVDVPSKEYKNFLAERHNNGGNVAFVDGHVKWYKLSQIEERKLQTGGALADGAGCPFYDIKTP